MARITISDNELEHLVKESISDFAQMLDVEYELDIQLGSGILSIGQLLELSPGNTLTLDRPATDYVAVVVGRTNLCEAEVLTRKKGTAARIIRLS